MECGLTRFSDGIKFGGTIDNPAGTQLPKLHRLEEWASRYLVKFNKEKQVLQLGRRDPPRAIWTLDGLLGWGGAVQKCPGIVIHHAGHEPAAHLGCKEGQQHLGLYEQRTPMLIAYVNGKLYISHVEKKKPTYFN